MRLLGLDYGKARIGVAVSDPLGITAQPLPFVKNDGSAFLKLKEIVSKYEVSNVVLGLPRTLKGDMGIAAQAVAEFGKRLEKELGVEVVFRDERMTTKLVERSYHEALTSSKKMRLSVDSSAASVILQEFMDRQKNV